MFATDPILTVHSFYQRPGGEDTAYRAESALLEARGHRVERMEYHNDALDGISSAQAAVRAVWNRRAAREVAQRVRATGARLVHFHNTFPLLSPAVYAGARSAGARVIQTLYNYRLVCPGALMLRDGAPCTACAGRMLAWPAVRHACYRDSRAASAVVATMLRVHRSAGTWTEQVDGYIAVSRFLRERMVEGGLPRDRVHVKGAHLADDPGVGTHRGGFALFVGRIAEEKGLRVLVDAWRRLSVELPLRILGDGPLRAEIEQAASSDARIQLSGLVTREEVVAAMRDATLLIVPSTWYEGAPLVFAEAAAVGLPVVASRIGGIPECVIDGETGVLFAPGDADALASAVMRLTADETERHAMSGRARAHFERTMSASSAYSQLMEIYGSVLGAA